jgi:hypothetical protein
MTAPVIRCLRCNWPAFRQVTITDEHSWRVFNGPACRACLDSFQQDGRYFTASMTIGPVVAGDTVSEWDGVPRPAAQTAEERGRLIYRVAASAARALSSVPGWQVERSGTCINVRFKGHGPRRHGDPPDYLIWVEDTTDMHLHRTLGEAGTRIADAYAAAAKTATVDDT